MSSYNAAVTPGLRSTAARAASLGLATPTDRKQPEELAVDLAQKSQVLKGISEIDGMRFVKPIEEIRRDKVKAGGILAVIERKMKTHDFIAIQARMEAEGITAEEAGLELDIDDYSQILDVVQTHFLADVKGYDDFINDERVHFAVQSKRAYSVAKAVFAGLSF